MPRGGMVATPPRSDAPVGQQKKGAVSQQALIPFAQASKWHIEQGNTVSISPSATQQIVNIPVPSYGYLSGILVTVAATGGNLTAATAFEDAPWSVLSQVMVQDVNGVAINQLSGFHQYLASKWGGYRLFPPDGYAAGTAGGLINELNSWAYASVSTSNGTFKFILPIFFEFGLDGLGCLPNMDNSARYNLQLTIAAYQSTSATGPLYTSITGTTPPSLSIAVEALCRSQPPATDMQGRPNSQTPPSVGTVQYWTAQTQSGLANGGNTIQLARVGNYIRNHLFVIRNANGTRASAEGADVPSTFQVDWDSGTRYIANVATLRYLMGYAVNGFDVPNGVISLPNTLDPDKIALSEFGQEWLPTVGATKFTLRFTNTAGNGSLTVLTNDVVPASGQVFQAPALQIL